VVQDPDPDPQQFVDDKPKCMKYVPIGILFQGFELLFGSMDPDPNPNQSERKGTDPYLHPSER
jgi:hypothetical protein